MNAFLCERKVSRGEPYTHTTKEPSSSLHISRDDEDQFMTLLCNSVKKKQYITITERPGPYGPLRVDFDLKASIDVGRKRQYTLDMVREIGSYYASEIKRIVDPEEFNDRMCYYILLEKKAPRIEQGVIKDGFHLHFPFFICEGWVQDN